jgi:2-haloalkanoic acid dehalogenase type II
VTETKAVFFDLAGTLFDDRALRDVHLAQLQRVADLCGEGGIEDADLRAAYRAGLGASYASVAMRPGYLHRDLFSGAYAAMATTLGGSLTPSQAEDLVDRQYRATVQHARPRPDCRTTLEALRTRGLQLQVVSNIDTDQLDDLVASFGLTDLLHRWISSEEAGSCKPHRAIFDHALAVAGCEPRAVWFVGDTPGHDVDGPAAVGMRTAWLRTRPADTPPPLADAVVDSLSEIPAVVAL